MIISDKDSELLRCLNQNGKASQRELAASTGVALGTVSNHIKNLENEKIIRGYFADIDPEKIGFTLTAIINLRITKGKIMDLQATIAKHPRVFGVYDVTGDFDSMVVARAVDRGDLDDLSKTVLSLDGITRSVTHFVLNTVKERPTSIPEN